MRSLASHFRGLRLNATSVIPLALGLSGVFGTTAHAQYARYTYPRGYADWGWGGWGGAGGATAQGDIARGLGAFAQGMGEANLNTAKADAINATTVQRWNDYMFQSQQQANRRYQEKLARDRASNVRTRDQIFQRLRNNPSTSDISRGDALNVAYDELCDPRSFSITLQAAKEKVPGTLIRDIPFQYASEAITTSVNQLMNGGPPAALKTDTFATDRESLKKIAADLRKQNEETGKHDPATLELARTHLQALRAKVETTYKRNTRERRDSEKWIKAAYGLTRLLETPAIDVLLAGVENRPDTTLGELLSFMSTFNFRFGAATTTKQRAAYTTLYPLLVDLRDKTAKYRTPDNAPARPDDGREAGDFFDAMDVNQLEAKAPAKPPVPAPAPK